MRKNFFKKKLATTVALAMVVASLTVPSSAQAAVATKIVKQGGAAAPTVLYVGDKGTDYGLSKTYKGNTYAWTTSNSAIATISKAGVVTAKAPGTVTIKCTVRDSKGKWLKAFTQKLAINLRATSIEVGDDFSLLVSESKDLNAVKTPAKSTDAVRYYSDNTAVATVDAKTGVVKAVGVGEATITVYSKATYKSATNSKYNKTDSLKVTVKDGIQSVKQTTTNKVELTFATDQSKNATKDNIAMTDADGIKQVVKGVSFSADGKTATVESYLDFEDGTVYKIAYAETEKSFTASVGDVASVVLKGKTVQYDTDTDLDYAAYDKNGIDVSSKVDWESDVDFDFDDSDADITWDDDDDIYQINVFDYPDTVDVEMTYTAYDEDTKDSTEYTSKATIKSVEELSNTASDIKYTLTDDDSNSDIDWDNDDLDSSISAEKESYRLFIKAENQDGDDIYEYNFDKFETTDDDILTVSYDDDAVDTVDNAVTIYPVKAGTAYIKATYGDTTKLLKVTVGDKAEAKSIKVDDTTVELYSTFKGEEYGATVNLDVLDQYGDELDYDDDAEVDHKSGSSDGIVSASVDEDSVTFYINDDATVSKTNDGSNTYKLTLEDKSVSVYVKVINVDTTKDVVKSVELVSNDADNEVDVKVDDDEDTNTTVKYFLYGLNSDGDRIQLMNTNTANITVYQDGDTLSTSDFADEGIVVSRGGVTGVVSFTAVEFGAGPVVTQASVATYKIKATIGGDTATKTLKVTNSQKKLTYKWDEQTLSESDDSISTVKDVVAEAFTLKYDGKDVDSDDIYEVDAVVKNVSKDAGDDVSAGDSVYIKSVTIKHELDNGKFIKVKSDVKKTVKVKE